MDAESAEFPPALPGLDVAALGEAEKRTRDMVFEIDAARRSARRLGQQGRWDEAWTVMRRLVSVEELQPPAEPSRLLARPLPPSLPAAGPSTPASSQVAAGSNPAPTPALPHELLVGIWHDLGVIAGRLGRWDESRGWFEQACRYQPRSAALRYDLALIERAAGRFDAARAHVHDALNLLMRPDLTEPRDPNQRRRLQTALERLRDQLPPPSRPP